jgi:hypothetical protein
LTKWEFDGDEEEGEEEERFEFEAVGTMAWAHGVA